MNRHLHRIVFNAARGMRMVVQETATSTGKGASRATSGGGTAAASSSTSSMPAAVASVLATAALFGLLAAMPSQAQIVGAPNVPGNLRPTVLVAPNGVPLINVQAPSAAGVSRNVYSQFNVGPNGVILNNSRANAQTQLGGWTQGNPNMAGGTARIILNEVNGGSPSQLRGYIEVGGQRAEVIIANPAGISVDGGGFINASRATLTTGTPQFSPSGSLDSFLVRGGTISIDGAGLDASKTDYAAILARAVQANAGIWASELKVVTGANQVSADHSQVTPVAGTGPVPTFALDVAALGGMYANKITLIGTEAGLGVRNAGRIGAGAGSLIVTASGRLENTGTLEGQSVQLASVASDIDNRGGTIRQTSGVTLDIAAPSLSNTSGGVIGLEPVPTPTAGSGGSTNTGGTQGAGGAGDTGTPAAGVSSGAGTGGATPAPATYVPPAPGNITAAGAVLNDGGRIYAGGPITLQSAKINNNGGTLSVANMAVNQPTFDNHGGTLNVSNSFSANVERFDNTGGKLNAGSLNITTSGDLVNTDGTLTSAADANFAVGGTAENTRGTVAATGALTANVAGATTNSAGTLASNQGLTLNTGSLENTKGSVQSAKAGVRLGVTNQLVSGIQGSINAATDLNVQAGSLSNSGSLRAGNDASVAVGGALTNNASITGGRNTTITAASVQSGSGVLGAGIQSDGKLGGVGDLRVTSTGALVANSTNIAAGNIALQGANVDLSASQTSAANIAITAAQGSVTASKATVVTPGTLTVTANGNGAQTLVNDAGKLNAGQLQINVSNIANTNAGEIVQTGTGATTIATSGTLNNDGGLIASNGQDLGLQAASIGNASGRIEHAGTGTLNIAGGSYSGVGGQITTNGALAVAMSSAFKQDGGTTSAKQITIGAASLGNRGGRIVQTGAAAGSIAVTGTVDNTSGVIANGGDTAVAIGDLSISAANIINTKGLIHSLGATKLNAGTITNDQTQGAGQGIEGKNVTIAVGDLSNDTGAIRADVDAAITSGGTITNTKGLISAGNELSILDPNRANPGAKTLNVLNANGTLVADKSLKVDAAKFSGDGKAVSGIDLSIALTQDIVNNGEVAANGNLTYSTTGNFTNNGKLLAGQTLTVGGSDVNNTVNAEMSGANTIVNAGGTLINRGLIDSQGATQINVGTLNNYGTGRIYGNAISIAAVTLNNDADPANGPKSGTIAARETLDIGATTINNREHALIFSGGLGAKSMSIGGALDANRKAIGQGTVLNNLSADIESLGGMSISMVQVNNKDTHIKLGPPVTTPLIYDTINIEGVGIFTSAQVIAIPGQAYVWARNPDGSQGALLNPGGNIWGTWKHISTTTADTAVDAAPARIVAGGDMNVNGRLYNENSKVLAGGAINANDYVAGPQLTGQSTTLDMASVYDRFGAFQETITLSMPPQQISLGGYEYKPNFNAASGYNAGTAPVGGGAGGAGGSSGANGGTPPGVVVEVRANTGSAGKSGNVPMVVRTSMPNTSVPNASLFNIRAGGNYLIETDPRFANYRNWLSSDYLLKNLGLDPNNTLKRLGDGFYEQKLIREQVAKLTGYRYLEGFNNDDEQYAALMNEGATFAKRYGLRPGVALSAAQMAQLTSDIVWLVEQTVTLPDGRAQQVLVPQVYVRVRPGDIDGSGALLSADATAIKSSGDLVNTGTIAGRSMVKIDAENVNNLGGRIAGGSIGINARNDLNNIGGSITARDAAVLTAGRDINIRTTTQSAIGAGGLVSSTTIDRVAGVYVANPGGTLIASAGRDVNLIGALLVSGGSAAVGAGRDINMGTVTESSAMTYTGKQTAVSGSQSREVGSVIQAQDNVRLAAGHDLNIRAGAVASVEGALVATARNDINITAGQATSNVASASQRSSKSLFKKSSSSALDSSSRTDVLSSSLSGKSVALVASNDINLQAAQLRSDEAMSLSAGRDINLTTASSSSIELHASQQRTSSTALSRAWALASDAGGPIGGYGNRKNSGNSTSVDIQTQAVGTTVSAGSLQTVSGRDTTLQAATVVADRDITMMAGRNLTIESAQNTGFSSSSSANAKSGFIGSWSAPGLGHIKDFGAQTTSSTTQQASQVASLAGNVTLVAGNEYRQTASSVLAAGQGGTLQGGDVNILARNVTINEAYDTEQTMGVQRGSSTTLGGSASVGALGVSVSTNDLLGGGGGTVGQLRNTVQAMGQTSSSRAQALGALNLAMTGKQVYDGVSRLASGASASSVLTYGVSVSLGRNTFEGTSFSNSSSAVGSSVTGANNVNIVATGGGVGSNIHAVGSTIAAGNNVNLAADNDIILEASRNATASVGRSDSHGTSVGVTLGAGAQTGLSFQIGVQNGQGRDNQNSITHTPTQVTGGNAVNISSGRDLTLHGATVEANRVTANVGGDLNITTLQDVSVGQSRQSSSGFGVSICVPPICGGAIVLPSASASGASANGTYISPGTQSGIRAGDGGFNVNVQGNTNLVGAVIESTQAAMDKSRNSFHTGGTLTMTDLQNVNQSEGGAYSVSASVPVGYGTRPTEATSSTPAQNSSWNWAAPSDASGNGLASSGSTRPTGSAGIGSYGSSQTSTTTSGISGIAGNTGVRTGDTSSAGTLVRDWNTQAIIKDVQAQAQVAQQFNQQATAAWGQYANSKLSDAQNAHDDEAAACWAANGACRAAGHAVIGSLSGGVDGAVGAVASTQAAPLIDRAATALGLTGTAHDAVVVGLTAAVGGALGGTLGAAGAFNEVNNNFLTGKQVAQKQKELAECKSNCLAIQNKWDRLDIEQQTLLDDLHSAERAVLKNPSEENIKELADAKKAWTGLYDKFSSEGDTGGMKFVKTVYFTANLNYQLACAKTVCVPPSRSEIMTGLAMNIDVAMATDGAMAGTVAKYVVGKLGSKLLGEPTSSSPISAPNEAGGVYVQGSGGTPAQIAAAKGKASQVFLDGVDLQPYTPKNPVIGQQLETSCASAACKMAGKINEPEAYIRSTMADVAANNPNPIVSNNGATIVPAGNISNIPSTLEAFGFKGTAKYVEDASIASLAKATSSGDSAVVSVWTGGTNLHAVVVDSVRNGVVYVRDPSTRAGGGGSAGESYGVPAQIFQNSMTGRAVYLEGKN